MEWPLLVPPVLGQPVRVALAVAELVWVPVAVSVQVQESVRRAAETRVAAVQQPLRRAAVRRRELLEAQEQARAEQAW